jgi:hypothetical protein
MGTGVTSHQAHARDRTVLIQESPIAGFQFHRGEAILPELHAGEELSLVRESFNRHDLDAVAVYFRNDKLGYVPRADNSAIAQMLDRGERLEARITQLLDDSDPWSRIRIGIFLT